MTVHIASIKKWALHMAFASALCLAGTVLAEPAPLLVTHNVVGLSLESGEAALAHAKSMVTKAIPKGHALAEQDSQCLSVAQREGNGRWECFYSFKTEAIKPPAKILWVLSPSRPDQLQSCSSYGVRKEVALPPGVNTANVPRIEPGVDIVRTAFEIRQGHELLFWQAGFRSDGDRIDLFEGKCFVISAGDAVLYQGAFVAERSARLLQIPVLVVRSRVGSRGTVFDLRQSFPGTPRPD